MTASSGSPPPILFTTSWDDGHATDVRLGELLAQHGAKGSFYVALNHPGVPEISVVQMRRLLDLGMEVGSHTFSHRLLPGLPYADLLFELTESKRRLEDALGVRVDSLSYPEGAFDESAVRAAGEAGYRVARTTVAFRTSLRFEPLRMPITVEFERKSRYRHLRHAVRDANVVGVAQWAAIAACAADPVTATRRFVAHARRVGGCVHLRARSWEIDRDALWQALSAALVFAREAGAKAVTNRELANAAAESVVVGSPTSP